MSAFGTVPTKLLLSNSLEGASARASEMRRGRAQKDNISRVAAEDTVESAEVSGCASSRSTPAARGGAAMGGEAVKCKKASVRPRLDFGRCCASG
jgi:hypothetical protein